MTKKDDNTEHAKKRTHDAESLDGISAKRPRTDDSILTTYMPPTQQAIPTGEVLPNPTLSQHVTKPMPEPVKRASQRPSRHVSQGSQTVDMHGSPVPEGMTIPDKLTVLEYFSQHAGISSDSVAGVRTIARRLADIKAADSISKMQKFVPPLHEPEVLSSNSKPVPAAPHEESQAITSIVRVDRKRPIVEDQTRFLSADPFTSSEEAREQPSQRCSSLNFVEQLRHITAAKAQEQDEDPDKTLVDPEPHIRASKRTSSLSTISSSDLSAHSEDSGTSTHDLAVWRNALQPHQMNLFDELVAVSHKLVRHLVDQETAIADIRDHYRRRGLHVVELMETTHAKQHQKDVQGLKERKKHLRKELVKCDRRLKEIVGAFESSKGELSERKATDAGEKQLLSVMEEYC